MKTCDFHILLAEIIKRLDKDALSIANSRQNANFTSTIKQIFLDIGKQFPYNCNVCLGGTYRTPDGQYNDPQWLYDITWVKQSNPKDIIVDLPLILESENDGREDKILIDFQKLIQSRAKFKIMIYKAWNADANIKLIREFIRQIEHPLFEPIGDRYLFVCHFFNQGKFEYRVYTRTNLKGNYGQKIRKFRSVKN